MDVKVRHAKLKERLDRGGFLSFWFPLLFGRGEGWGVCADEFFWWDVCGTDLDAVNLDADEWSSDINNVTSVLKLWLRELPEPVMTTVLHQHFIDAASEFMSNSSRQYFPYVAHETLGIENPRLRHIRLHEHVNDLPDPNYATLKYFLGHLQRCVSFVLSRLVGVVPSTHFWVWMSCVRTGYRSSQSKTP